MLEQSIQNARNQDSTHNTMYRFKYVHMYIYIYIYETEVR